MDLATLIGLIFGILALVIGFLWEGGQIGTLFEATALLIVVGGTIGAVIVSYPLSELKRLPALTMDAFRDPSLNTSETIAQMVEMATIARREGVLALESHLDDMDVDPVMKEGLQLVIDGSDPELIKEMLEIELEFFERQNEMGARMYETAGG